MRALHFVCLSLALSAAVSACGTAKSVGGDDTGLIGGDAGASGGGSGGGSTSVDTTVDPWCNVQAVMATKCVSCHSTSGPLGDLDLESSPWDALVGVDSTFYAGRTLVVPGDAAASFLITKLDGTQATDEGTIMPPGSSISDAQLAEFQSWIDAGAGSPDCGVIGTTGAGTGFHAAGYAEPSEHGLDAKLAVLNCTECHGADLTGDGEATSCDTCHQADWRTTCTYCHGGMDNATGAPPEDIDDGATDVSFGSHSAHVEGSSTHVAYDCASCHTVPDNVLSPGHLWDGTAGQAEVDMSASLSSAGSWTSGSMSCANLYCHGNGQGNNGSVTASESMSCHSCHADRTTSSGWSSMSGEHSKHLSEGLECSDCHAEVASGSSSIVDASLHVNGSIEWASTDSTLVVGTDGSCTGLCHWEGHWYETW